MSATVTESREIKLGTFFDTYPIHDEYSRKLIKDFKANPENAALLKFAFGVVDGVPFLHCDGEVFDQPNSVVCSISVTEDEKKVSMTDDSAKVSYKTWMTPVVCFSEYGREFNTESWPIDFTDAKKDWRLIAALYGLSAEDRKSIKDIDSLVAKTSRTDPILINAIGKEVKLDTNLEIRDYITWIPSAFIDTYKIFVYHSDDSPSENIRLMNVSADKSDKSATTVAGDHQIREDFGAGVTTIKALKEMNKKYCHKSMYRGFAGTHGWVAVRTLVHCDAYFS